MEDNLVFAKGHLNLLVFVYTQMRRKNVCVCVCVCLCLSLCLFLQYHFLKSLAYQVCTKGEDFLCVYHEASFGEIECQGYACH